VRRLAFTFRGAGPLGERDFRLLLAARFSSLFGNGMAPIAIAFAVLELHPSASALSLVVGARMLPMVAFMLVGGVIADRFPRQRVMLASNLLAGAAQVATAALLLLGAAQLWQLVALQAIGGAGSAFFLPALNGLVPQIIAKASERQQANALLGLTRDGARIGGAALGGLIVAAAGAGWGIGVDAACFFVSAGLLAPLRVEEDARPPRRALVRELAEGWHEFRAHRWVWVISAQFAVTNATGMACFFVLGPLVSEQSLGGPAGWGIVLAGYTSGLVVGGLVGLRITFTRPLLAAPACALLIVPLVVLLAVRAPLALVATAAVAAGATGAVFGVVFDTALQRHIPQERLSRVTSYSIVASFASIPLGVGVVGVVADVIGASATLWVASVVVACAGLATLAARDVRMPAQQPPEAAPIAA
jgi:MFS family permease